jgi:hypothetical protein
MFEKGFLFVKAFVSILTPFMALSVAVILCVSLFERAEAAKLDWNSLDSEPPLEINEDAYNISIHFDPQFTAVYSKSSCALYQTWKPGKRDVWYQAPEAIYYHQNGTSIWDVVKNNRSILDQVIFSTFNVKGNSIDLHYTLTLKNGEMISVVETPKYDAHYGSPRLMRNMILTGISQEEEVRVSLSDSRNPFLRLSGGGQLEQVNGRSTLVVDRDGFSQALLVWDLSKRQ